MATTERPPDGENATTDAEPIGEQGPLDSKHRVLTTLSGHRRWRSLRTRELLRLAGEADMFVWEKVRLRDLRDDLEAETRRRQARERIVYPGEAGVDARLELVDFERDSWPQ
jgi:hypothetical protein